MKKLLVALVAAAFAGTAFAQATPAAPKGDTMATKKAEPAKAKSAAKMEKKMEKKKVAKAKTKPKAEEAKK